MPTPAEVVEQGFARGEEARLQKQAQRETFDLAQKQWQRDQAMSAANRIAVPDAATDPEGNAKALKQRQALIDMAQNVFTPEDHGTFFHRLIFGPQAQQQTPVSSQAPQRPGTYTPPSTGPIPNQPLQTMPLSPYVNNPQHNKLLQDLDALNNRLKFAIHPPKQASPSLSSLMAGVPSEREIAQQDAATKAKEEEKLAELRNQGQLDVAKARSQFASMSTPQKSFLNRWAVDHGADDFNGLSSDQQSLALKAFKGANAPASHLQLKSENGNLYTFDPATGKMTFKAKLGDVRKTQGVRFVTNTLTGEVTEVPYTTYTSKESGEPIADDSGAPIGAADDQKAPVSAQAPSLDAVNSKIAAGNASSKKLNKGKPVSSNAPRVVAHTASLMDKSDAAQYTKIAEDANNKEEAFKSAQEALKAPTASSDQELIYSWVRSNVQGAGRMTQAEFRQAASTGSLPLRAQAWFEKAKSGRLPPELEQMMFADIKRSYETSRDEAANLRNRIGASSSQVPQSSGKVINYKIVNGVLVPE